MQYMSDLSSPKVSRNNGYWIKADKIYDLTDGIHAKFIIANPVLFDLTEDAVQVIDKTQTEHIGGAAMAREVLLRNAASKGWIGVRRHTHLKYWSIQCDATERRKVTINDFILWALENEIMSRHDPAVLIGLNDPTDRHLYDWKSVGIQRQMEGGQ